VEGSADGYQPAKPIGVVLAVNVERLWVQSLRSHGDLLPWRSRRTSLFSGPADFGSAGLGFFVRFVGDSCYVVTKQAHDSSEGGRVLHFGRETLSDSSPCEGLCVGVDLGGAQAAGTPSASLLS
jgi:hypothetical protein